MADTSPHAEGVPTPETARDIIEGVIARELKIARDTEKAGAWSDHDRLVALDALSRLDANILAGRIDAALTAAQVDPELTAGQVDEWLSNRLQVRVTRQVAHRYGLPVHLQPADPMEHNGIVAAALGPMQPAPRTVTAEEVWDAYNAARLVPLYFADNAAAGPGVWRERDRVYAMLAALGITVEVPRG